MEFAQAKGVPVPEFDKVVALHEEYAGLAIIALDGRDPKAPENAASA
ncbi:hypothetical protein [Kitasatospora sp. NPDC057936]